MIYEVLTSAPNVTVNFEVLPALASAAAAGQCKRQPALQSSGVTISVAMRKPSPESVSH